VGVGGSANEGVGSSGRGLAGGVLLEGYSPPGGGVGVGALVWDERGCGRLLWLPQGGGQSEVATLDLPPAASIMRVSHACKRGGVSVCRKNPRASGGLAVEIVQLTVELAVPAMIGGAEADGADWERERPTGVGVEGSRGVGAEGSRGVAERGARALSKGMDAARSQGGGLWLGKAEGFGSGGEEEVTASMTACPRSSAPHVCYQA